MLGFFPELIEGEHLVSALGRLSEALGHPPRHILCKMLYGSEKMPALDCPNQISRLTQRIPDGGLDAAHLIDNHTPFNYYASFSSPAAAARLRSVMLGDNIKDLRYTLGGRWRHSPNPERFRFCLKCAREDLSLYGFYTFKRQHQLPCVFACAKHFTSLCESRVIISGHNREYRSPSIDDLHTSPRVLAEPLTEPIIMIAAATEKLLSSSVGCLSEEDLAKAMFNILADRGWVRGRIVALKELRDAARAWLGSTLFSRLGFETLNIKGDNDSWPSGLYRTNGTCLQPVFRYLALLVFLGNGSDGILFEKSITKIDDIVLPPYVNGSSGIDLYTPDSACANPECSLFSPSFRADIEARVPSGVEVSLHCSQCGHVRAWKAGAALSCRIINGGPDWDESIRSRVAEGFDIQFLAKRLSIGSQTVVREARRLGVWGRSWNQARQEVARPSNRDKRIDAAVKELRDARLANPFWTRSDFERRHAHAYRLLAKHAKEDLEAVMPARGRPGRLPPDWSEMDMKLTTEARTLAAITTAQRNNSAGLSRYTLITLASKKVGYCKAGIYKNAANLPHFWSFVDSSFPSRIGRKKNMS